MAHEARDMAKNFLASHNVQKLLEHIMRVPGYRGSGFRAKECLVDILENSREIIGESRWPSVWEQICVIVVIGVGPVRTINWIFNRPFYVEHREEPWCS